MSKLLAKQESMESDNRTLQLAWQLFEDSERFRDLMENLDFIKVDIITLTKLWETLGKTKDEFDSIYQKVTQISHQGKKVRDQFDNPARERHPRAKAAGSTG